MGYSFNNDYKSITFVIDTLSHNPKLTGWEKSYINDTKHYTDNGGFLSERQLNILSQIWEKY